MTRAITLGVAALSCALTGCGTVMNMGVPKTAWTPDPPQMKVYGGVDAPYVWLKTPGGLSSWAFFDKLLNECHVVGTPGSGFGAAGEGYFRVSAFNSRANVTEAMTRFRTMLG